MFPGAPSNETLVVPEQSEPLGCQPDAMQGCEATLLFQEERSCSGSWAAHWAACRAAHSSGTLVTPLISLWDAGRGSACRPVCCVTVRRETVPLLLHQAAVRTTGTTVASCQGLRRCSVRTRNMSRVAERPRTLRLPGGSAAAAHSMPCLVMLQS